MRSLGIQDGTCAAHLFSVDPVKAPMQKMDSVAAGSRQDQQPEQNEPASSDADRYMPASIAGLFECQAVHF
jgi:hypothetical protein